MVQSPLTRTRIERCETWLERARKAPVCIFINMLEQVVGSNEETQRLVRRCVVDMISKHLDHCCSLLIECLPCIDIAELIDPSNEVSAPLLEEFSAVGGEKCPTPPSWSINTPRLRRFRLRGVTFCGTVPLENLTSFHHQPTNWDREPCFNLKLFLQLFRISPNLTDLDVDFGWAKVLDPLEENEKHFVYTLQSIKRVALRTHIDETMTTIISVLSFPSVEQLSLYTDESVKDGRFPYRFQDHQLASLRILQATNLPDSVVFSLLDTSPFLQNITLVCPRSGISSSIASIVSSPLHFNNPITLNFIRCSGLNENHLLRLAGTNLLPTSNGPSSLISIEKHNVSRTSGLPNELTF